MFQTELEQQNGTELFSKNHKTNWSYSVFEKIKQQTVTGVFWKKLKTECNWGIFENIKKQTGIKVSLQKIENQSQSEMLFEVPRNKVNQTIFGKMKTTLKLNCVG